MQTKKNRDSNHITSNIKNTVQKKEKKSETSKNNPFENALARAEGNPFENALIGPTVQAKLSIGQANDQYEKEADKIADQVVSMPQSQAIQAKCIPYSAQQGSIQKQSLASQITPLSSGFAQKKCAACTEEEQIQGKFVQMFGGNNTASSQLEGQINGSKGGGNPMDAQTLNSMNNSFGTDFSGVRIHTGNTSVQMNQELGAKAFTVGNDIHFNQGEYNPESQQGKRLLAHELVHTVQQGATQTLAKKDKNSTPSTSIQKSTHTSIIQKDGIEDKVLEELDSRGKDKTPANGYDPQTLKHLGKTLSDDRFKSSFGVDGLGTDLIQDIVRDVKKVYDYTKEGQREAVDRIENEMNKQIKKDESNTAMMLALVSAVTAFIPVASAANIAYIERRFQASLPKGVRLKELKILPKYAQTLKDWSADPLRGAISPALTLASKFIPGRDAVKWKEDVGTVNDKLSELSAYTIHALVLRMAQQQPETPNGEAANVSSQELGILRGAIHREVLRLMFAEYFQANFFDNNVQTGIKEYARNEFLKKIIFQGTKVGSNWRGNKIIDQNNKENSSDVADYALRAIGGQSELAKTLKNPFEYAFYALDNRIKAWGLELNITDQYTQSLSTTGVFGQHNWKLPVKVTNINKFRAMLSTSDRRSWLSGGRYTYSPVSGPIKDINDQNPGKSESMLGLPHAYNHPLFDFPKLSVSNISVKTNTKFITSAESGKIKDFTHFWIEFEASGNGRVSMERVTRSTGYGNGIGSISFKKEQSMNGLSKILVTI